MDPLDPDICYRALQTRDARFDGRLFVGVISSISIGPTRMGTLCSCRLATAALTPSTSSPRMPSGAFGFKLSTSS
jgi:methylphosphotriester-DNA--protein-cysteine methyltransferase